jgi:DNA-binding protein Fis
MERAAGNKSEAARALGLKRTTFLDKLKRHGLHGADWTEGTAA